MAGSATITGTQHYVAGIGHPKTETTTEAPPVMALTDPLTGGIAGLSAGGVTLPVPTAVAGVVQALLIGDSMTAQNNSGNAVISAAVRSGGIVTVTSTAHGFADQVPTDIENMVPADFNANGAIVTRIDANTFSYPAAGSDGPAAALGGTKPMIAINRQSQSDLGYFVWLNGKSGGAFNLVRNAGANGQTAADMRERFERDVLAFNPQAIILLSGYNDFVNASRTAQAVYDDVVAMCAASAGKQVTVVSALPWTTGGTTAQRAQAVIYNRMIRNYCNSTQNVRFADAARLMVDSINATRFSALTGMLGSDGIHPTPKGAERIAQAIYDVNKDRIPLSSRLVSTNADNIGYDAGSKNIVDNAPWTNTGGALGGTSPATGTVAGGWGVTNNGTGTTVASVITPSDGVGYQQQAVFTPSANNDSCVVSLSGTSWGSGRFVAGDKVRCMFELSVSGLSGANIKSIETRIGFNNTPATSAHPCSSSQSSAANYPTADYTMPIISQDIVIPAGASTMSFQVTTTAAAAGTAVTVRARLLSIEKL